MMRVKGLLPPKSLILNDMGVEGGKPGSPPAASTPDDEHERASIASSNTVCLTVDYKGLTGVSGLNDRPAGNCHLINEMMV